MYMSALKSVYTYTFAMEAPTHPGLTMACTEQKHMVSAHGWDKYEKKGVKFDGVTPHFGQTCAEKGYDSRVWGHGIVAGGFNMFTRA